MSLLTRPFGLLKGRLLIFRKEAVILWYALRHRDTPFGLRIATLLVGLYLLSPIDLIPITVPFLGVLDDLIIVPWGVAQITKRLPASTVTDSSQRADRAISRYFKRPLLAALVILLVIVTIWIAIGVLIWRLIFG
jgi:uncharacterized membrane protein YkvA (DUF1232 family)